MIYSKLITVATGIKVGSIVSACGRVCNDRGKSIKTDLHSREIEDGPSWRPWPGSYCTLPGLLAGDVLCRSLRSSQGAPPAGRKTFAPWVSTRSTGVEKNGRSSGAKETSAMTRDDSVVWPDRTYGCLSL